MRRLLRNRFLVPVTLVGIVAACSLLAFLPSTSRASAAAAGAATAGGAGGSVGGSGGTGQPAAQGVSSGGGVGAGNFASGISLPPTLLNPLSTAGPRNSGTGNSSIRVHGTIAGHRTLVAYGSSAITYKAPHSQSQISAGQAIFGEYCSTCHGSSAQGSAIAPDLQQVGPATVMLWVTTGRMPAAYTNEVQAEAKAPKLSYHQALDIAAWVNSLNPSAPYIPYPNLKHASLSDGAVLFSLNCAACHTITGAGDALAFDTFAPTLHKATAQQVAEAIRTGPANMPRFSGNLSDAQVRDVVAYVTESIQHPDNQGGAGLGGVGPVAEGFVGLLIGVGLLFLASFWIGDRT